MTNKKSDVPAKAAFVKELINRGYDAQVTKAPADIKAIKDGQVWYFEIKMTEKAECYFGASTYTEWKQAFEDPDHFRFVVAIDLGDDKWKFVEYTPEELMQFSTIPPFKINFTVNANDKEDKPNRRSTTIRLSLDNFAILVRAFDKLKRG